jgi:hypothetical protein
VDNQNLDNAAGRPQAVSEAAGHSEMPNGGLRPATHLPDPGPDAEPVTICGWCPSLHILNLQKREQDVIIIYQQGKELRIIRNGVNLNISHGICIPCRERLRR